MILFSHPTGNSNVRGAAQALLEAGLLAEYWTCVSWDPESAWNRFLPGSLRRQLVRRALPPPLRQLAWLHPWREAGRMAASRLGLEALIAHERGPFCIDAVYRSLDHRVSRRVAETASRLTGVYAYEDGAAATFASAKAHGLRCLYDLPIGYWRAARAIYDEEREREPAWACTLTGALDSPEKLARKDEELRQADAIFVGSQFTRTTLQGAPLAEGKPVHVIPYGAPPAPDIPAPRRAPGGKLRVLFVGSLGQRKGLSYLLEALGMLGGAAAELTLIGMKTAPDCAPLNAAVSRHRWLPTLPHAEVLREMSAHDVLVFPSLFEGFGLVLLEALSRGLPIITTEHTGGPDLLGAGAVDGSSGGFIVPVRSARAIAEKLDLLAADQGLRLALQSAARETALRFTWESYRARLAQAVAEQMR
ncbi:MAG: glycosyltransferase family 4 protein [Chthoniobacteraceae bacterium]